MKKVLSMVLAVVMVMGTMTMAMAATTNFAMKEMDFTTDSGYFAADGVVQNDVDIRGTHITSGVVNPGKTVYFKVNANKIKSVGGALQVDAAAATKLSDLSNFRIGYTANDGKNMINSIKFVQIKAKVSGQKELFVAVSLKDNYIKESTSVDLDIKVTAVSGNAVVSDLTLNAAIPQTNNFSTTNISFESDYNTETVTDGWTSVNGSTRLEFDEDATDANLALDNGVEVSGNMANNSSMVIVQKDSNDTLSEKYPDATLRLFPSTNDTFRREVSVMVPFTAEKAFIYEVDAKGVLTAVKGAKFADDSFTFKTKALSNYVLSETELKSVVTEGDKNDNTTGGNTTTDNEKNPETGANDFVGLAVAMAVVSVAGIAVAKRK